MRCNVCEVVDDVHETGCPNRLGSRLYRTETDVERLRLQLLLIELLTDAGVDDEYDEDDVLADEDTWEYVRQEIRDGRDLDVTHVRVVLGHSEDDDGGRTPWMVRVGR